MIHGHVMNIKSAVISVALLAATFSVPALAAAEEEAWKGELGLGGVRTGGNTQIQSINATAMTGRSWGAFELKATGKALSSSDRGASTSEKYNAGLSLNYHFSDRFFVFQDSGFTKDLFSGYTHRIIATVGVGYKVIKTEAHTLEVLAGGGIRQNKIAGVAGKTQNEGVAGGSLQYHWVISPTSSFKQSISSQYGKENTVSNFNSDLNMQIIGNLSAQLGFHLTHTSKVPFPSIKKTDTESTVNMVYSF
ncbi:MAG: DUF481 domain-containing protein [Mariprofundaceae bacterium]|nr:DUF481 domain-containing protein [Mariprofundaceae bacterium]